jgi:uncharacterized repeat protein (TIGR03803 family)
MLSPKLKTVLTLAAISVASNLAVLNPASAQVTEHVLHTFTSQPTGFPSSSLTSDSSGNLYGLTAGSVYELTPNSSGGWTYHLLAFVPGGRGDFAGGKLAIDAAGNLYGSTWQGGSSGCGFVFEVSPPSSGTVWTVNDIHQFSCTDGAAAGFTMAFDAAGNLYGGTHNGGPNDYGVVFKLTPGAEGWTYAMLHAFTNAEGNGPQTGLVFDKNGNLFGGNESDVYELSPNSDGTWTESAAFAFTDATGFNPFGDLIFDAAGNLYGTNQAGGLSHGGTAFMLSPSAAGWTATVLHSFGSANDNDGYYPEGALTFDSAGNLYGTTTGGGGTNDGGIIYELSPVASGAWTETILHRFGASGSPGGTVPQNAPYLDASGNLYGVTAAGGDPACYTPAGGCGTIFKIVR